MIFNELENLPQTLKANFQFCAVNPSPGAASSPCYNYNLVPMILVTQCLPQEIILHSLLCVANIIRLLIGSGLLFSDLIVFINVLISSFVYSLRLIV